jgi:hypothetical protein
MNSPSDEYYPKYQDLRRANKEYARQEVIRLHSEDIAGTGDKREAISSEECAT